MQIVRMTQFPLAVKIGIPIIIMLIFYFACEYRKNETILSSYTSGISDKPDITKAEYIVWKNCIPTNKSGNSFYRVAGQKNVIDGFGNPLAKQIRYLTDLKPDIYNPVLEVLPSGNLLIAWMQSNTNSLNEVFCRIYDENFIPISDEIKLNEPGEKIDVSNLEIRYISNNEAIVAWAAQSNDGTYNLSVRVVNVEEEFAGLSLNINYWGKIRKPRICNSGMGYAISFISEENLPIMAFFNRFHAYQGQVNLASDIQDRKSFMNLDVGYDHSINRFIAFFTSDDEQVFFRTISNSVDLGLLRKLNVAENERMIHDLPFLLSIQQNCICARYVVLFHVIELGEGSSDESVRVKRLTVDRRIDRVLSEGRIEYIEHDSVHSSLISTCIFPSRSGFVVLANEIVPDSANYLSWKGGRIVQLYVQ